MSENIRTEPPNEYHFHFNRPEEEHPNLWVCCITSVKAEAHSLQDTKYNCHESHDLKSKYFPVENNNTDVIVFLKIADRINIYRYSLYFLGQCYTLLST